MGSCWGLAHGSWAGAASITGKGRDVFGADMEHGSIRHGRVAVKCSANRRAPDPHGTSMVLGPSHACSVPADVVAGLSCWGQAEVGAAGSSVHHHPPQCRAWLGWGLAALILLVLRGWCPGSLTRRGAKQVPSGADKGFPLWLAQRDGCQQGQGQPGRRAAGIPHCFSRRQLPEHFIVTWRVFGGCWRLSPSLGVTLGHRGVNVPFHAWLPPSQADNCHRSQHIPAEMLHF